MSVTIDSIVVRENGLPAASLDGDVVVLSVNAGSYFSLNGVASEIWQMIAEPRPVRDIFAALSRSHDVDDMALSRDVLPFLESLVEKRLARQLGRDSAQ